MWTYPAQLLQISKQLHFEAGNEGATVPVQGSEAHQTLQVGLGVDVPLPYRVQLEAWQRQHLKIWQDGVQSIWKT